MSVSLPVNSSTELKRGALGVGFIIFFVVSAASPLSVIAGGFPIGIMLGNGAGTPALLILALLVLLMFSVGYTTMSRHVTNAGGFYAFTSRGLGGLAGGAAGVLAMFAYNILQVGLYGMFGGVVSGTMASVFGLELPWWAYSLMAMASVAILGYRKIDLSARVLSVIVIAEYLAILTLDFAILSTGGDSGVNLDAFDRSHVFSGTPSIGLLFCFAAFIGFEATTIYGEEARNPQRTIPIATYCSVLLIGGFYALSVWSMVVGVGADKIVPMLQALQDPTTFIYGMSDHFVGPHLTQIIRVLFMVSIYAGLLAFHNAAARYFYAIGRDGLLPRQLGTTHRVHQSPHMGSVLQSLISAVVVLIFAAMDADPILQLFAWLSNLATLCVILLMALTSAAVFAFSRRHPELKLGFWRGGIFPALSCLVLLAVLIIAVLHFDVLTGASQALSYGLCAIIPAALLAGVLLAARLRKGAPERYLMLGSHKL
ncbi:APC family permease [Pseudomonas mediterranea]|uniref:Amino acid transporter n=1 Tax=Pseudomonas mediterranea TaxID=183795 RepID=A0AAX2DFR1_9PSED|nr:APC family permease [Pseudomonas mediterranea]KGU83226.1 amino acid permease [Pseudomonas mediterranea CFBP 5447]MBL0841623.1 APC family permease [Pseudomonas mediterranea]MDU9030198.1 APC family permease [Pseudomonas mediterranea]UZD98631.1 APC family permease [Pseudomonas mediterranea]CAH0261350.1 putative amino acid permease YhdG [Pseudomonas mediterranea]